MFESKAARGGASGRAAGFTIVELMITVAVASILLAIAIPSFNQMIISGRLTAQANEMVAAMTLARSEAIKRNANITFCRPNPNDATVCATARGEWQGWMIRTGAGNVVRRGDVNTFNGALVMTSTLTSDQVVFGPDGLARTGGGTVSDHVIRICSRRAADRNVRQIVMGAGSRMSTGSATETC